MCALDMPLAAMRLQSFRKALRAVPPPKTYCCRYCGQDGLQWKWHNRLSAWRLMTHDLRFLHNCPNFTPRRRAQYEAECRMLHISPRGYPCRVVKIRAKKRVCKCR